MQKHLLALCWLVILILGINLQACSSIQQMVQGTPTSTPTITLTPSPTATATLASTPTPSVTPDLVATQQYGIFIERVQQFYEQGYIPSTKGTYRHLGDYSDSLAQAGYYQETQAASNTKNYIVRSDLTMQTVNQTFVRGGCGFVIRGFDMLMLSQKGNVYRYDPIFGILATNYVGESFNPWGLEIVLIYSEGNGEENAMLFIDGKLKLKVNLADFYLNHLNKNTKRSTNLAFAIISGSNNGYGTRCDFKNIDYWSIEK